MQTFKQPLSKESEAYYIKKCKTGDLEARNMLVEYNLRLVAHIVKKYNTPERDTEDLISIGTIGLIKAINTYDDTKGNRLVTYASRCIENAILSQMRLWFKTSTPRAKENQNGVFWHRFPKIFTSFAPLRTAM